ncbi:transmembrane protein, putative [Medicago truncatula]|uniref:Transmembrane protein, putative n=1 Tax=Medicago truncatula TaxID=3880 RepID=A0A072UHN5_MEDTR|nr:transmembrane protein, putative [Medicago truncatula]
MKVNWKGVCKPKRSGGLGLKDVRLFNIVLLAKWMWNLLSKGESLRKKVLIAKYMNLFWSILMCLVTMYCILLPCGRL